MRSRCPNLCQRGGTGAKARRPIDYLRLQPVQSHRSTRPNCSIKREPTVGSTVCSPHAFAGLACVAEFSADANAVVPFDFCTSDRVYGREVAAAHDSIDCGQSAERRQVIPLERRRTPTRVKQREAIPVRGRCSAADWRYRDPFRPKDWASWDLYWAWRCKRRTGTR